MIIIYSVCSSYFTLVLDNQILLNMFLSQNARLCMCTHSTVFVARLLIDSLWFVGLSSVPELKSSPASCCPNSCAETFI